MGKVSVGWQKFLHEPLRALQDGGLLLTSVDATGRPNPMTIGWASHGIYWGQPVLVVMVRPSRYTFGCMEMTGDFTVSVPYPDLSEQVALCGTRSGRNTNKFEECGFTPENIDAVRSPGIEQCGLTYFCRCVHRNDVLPSQLDESLVRACYPSDDFHRFYYGQIVETLADEDFSERFNT
jgi:flavin reductase (DIM6/NTAB) family NADH-FMN oxidoreductase RutF